MEVVDFIWVILGVILVLVGFVGCFLPILPGPPLSYLALLCLQLTGKPPYTTDFLIFWLFIAVLVTALDYVIPILGAKKLGGSKWGIVGSGLGLLLGIILLPPIGIILGPPIGAWLGEMLSGKAGVKAFKAALGSFIGFITGTFIKLISSLIMSYYFVEGILQLI